MSGAAALLLAGAAPADADAEQIDSFDVRYRLDDRGVLHVTERIVYRFGDNASRRGIERVLTTREPDRDRARRDIVYEISGMQVSSPDPVSTALTVSSESSADGRRVRARYRIGDPDRSVDAETATYVLRYTVQGSVRDSGEYDALIWDAVGVDLQVPVHRTSVQVSLPGEVGKIRCFAGVAGSQDRCADSGVHPRRAWFEEYRLRRDEGLTVEVRMESGLVEDNQLHRELAADMPRWQRAAELSARFILPAVIIVAFVAGWFHNPRAGWHQRYRDLPPGTFPASRADSRTGLAWRKRIPVRFTPPDLPVAMTGLLLTGQVRPADAAATIVAMAARGRIKINKTDGWRRRRRYELELIDTDAPDDRTERALLAGLFGTEGSPTIVEDPDPTLRFGSTTVQFTDRRRLARAYRRLLSSVRHRAQSAGWFSGGPPEVILRPLGLIIATSVVALLAVVFSIRPIWPPLLIAVGLVAIGCYILGARFRARRGTRSAEGTAWADQLIGFRTYLATVDAERLQFEEGEDIYSAYLPWAIAYGLANRWTKICRRLSDRGRIPDSTGWYRGEIGDFDTRAFIGGLSAPAGETFSEAGGGDSDGITADAGITGGLSGGGYGGGGFGGGAGGGGGGAGGGGGGGGVGGW